MPLNNDTGEYEVTTAEQIDAYLRDVSKQDEYFGPDHDLTPNSVYSSLYATIAEAQEFVDEDIKNVYESAFLDTATGADLDKVVELVGIQRRAAQRATGYVTFSSQGPVSNQYTIPNRLRLTTSNNAVGYETTETRDFAPIERFETDIDDYTNSADFSLQTTTVFEGTSALQSDTASTLYTNETRHRRGDTTVFHVQGDSLGVRFLVQNADEYFETYLDGTTLTLSLESASGTVNSTTTPLNTDGGTWYRIDVLPRTTETRIQVRDTTTNDVLASIFLPETHYRNGGIGFTTQSSTPQYYDFVTERAIATEIRAVEGGVDGNTASNTVTNMPSPPNGVTSVTNELPVGDPQYTNLNGEAFIAGRNEETDATLRSRVRDTVTGGGKATANAIVSALVNDVSGVSSISLFENNSGTTVDGLPPYSFECVVLGGNDIDIAETIFETKAVTATDVGGINGAGVTETIIAENNQEFDIEFSRPVETQIQIDATVVTTDEYVGEAEIADELVNYIGGQNSNNNSVIGLGVGDDVYIDEIENIIVGIDETGVRGIDASTTTYTPSPTTDANNLEVISIADNEVASLQASDVTLTEI